MEPIDRRIQDYIHEAPDARRGRLRDIIDLILSMYPKAEQSMDYRMPTFRNGCRGWIAVASQKHYVSVYTCGADHLIAFKKQHPGLKTGKGCINLRAGDTVKPADLKRVIQSAMGPAPRVRTDGD